MAIPSTRFISQTVDLYKRSGTGLAISGRALVQSDVPASAIWPHVTDYETLEQAKTFRSMLAIFVITTTNLVPGDYVKDSNNRYYEIERVNNYHDYKELFLYDEVSI